MEIVSIRSSPHDPSLWRDDDLRWRYDWLLKSRQGHLWQRCQIPEMDTFVALSHRCGIIWLDQAAEVTVQTVNVRRVALKMRTGKNRENLARK